MALVLVSPVPAPARVDVGINISLPPAIVFAAPPEVVVIPETYIYAVPDVDADIYFYNGWWWRPWGGHWYRSRYYNSGWVYYQRVPSFYVSIPSNWRNDYREHRWAGHQWNYQRIPHQQVQQNWRNWKKSKHWEKQNTWGVQGLKTPKQSQRPSQVLQPQAKPQGREVQQQQPRPKSEAKPLSREVTKPQRSEPHSREVRPQQSQPHPQESPQLREVTKPRQSLPQHREAPQKSEHRGGKPERERDEKQDRK